MGVLNTFPISLKVAGKRVVIVGGGAEALNKARLMARTTARIDVFATEITVDFDELRAERLRVHRRAPAASDLEDAAMMFAAGAGGDGEAALALARAAGVPVNVVDRPEQCSFYTPAIVDRAPLTVAISTEGAAPVLARQVRARIEALLAPKLGALAALMGRMRGAVEARIGDGAGRRRFYQSLADSEQIADALDLGVSRAWQEAADLLERQVSARAEEGVVWLIGAGPGSEDLLTLRAQRLLQEADAIVHDQLVPEAVIGMGRRDAARINVGKAKGAHSFSQKRINDLLAKLANEGKRVARLKSGDPMVFGRAGEEIAALRKAGIAYRIVPGVTAALAAAADTAVPVTLRKVSSGVVFATAHGADEGELGHWAALAGAGMTLALYMGKSIAGEVAGRLIAKGMAGTTPAGVVVNAGRAVPARSFGTLAALAAGAADFGEGPAVILIGEAVAKGDWSGAGTLLNEMAEVA